MWLTYKILQETLGFIFINSFDNSACGKMCPAVGLDR